MNQVIQAAEASAELARRMAQVGNFNKLQQAREQSFYADAAQGLARAQRHEAATRERLIRLLGLWGDQTALQLPDRLPDLPPTVRDLPDAERTAIAQRLDVQAARLATEQTARNLGLTQTTRFINVLELGLIRNSSNEAPTTRGWEVSLELPLFDWGGARVAKAEAIYMQSVHVAADTAVHARSEVREAYGNYRSAYDIARHQRDEVVPLRQRIAEENMLRYNGMLIGVFELLADARAQISGVATYIDTLREFWLAQADLDMALIGPASLSASTAPRAAAPRLRAPATEQGHPHRFQTQLPLWRRRHHRRRRQRHGQQSRPGRPARARHPDQRRHPSPAGAAQRPPLQPRRHPQRLDPALAHEQRRQGVPPRGRARGARDGARLRRPPVGLQRPVTRPHHRGGRRRPRAHLRHQQTARSHQRALARPAPALRHGRRHRPRPSHPSPPAKPLCTSSWRAAPAPSCTTRTPMKWCKWPWA